MILKENERLTKTIANIGRELPMDKVNTVITSASDLKTLDFFETLNSFNKDNFPDCKEEGKEFSVENLSIYGDKTSFIGYLLEKDETIKDKKMSKGVLRFIVLLSTTDSSRNFKQSLLPNERLGDYSKCFKKATLTKRQMTDKIINMKETYTSNTASDKDEKYIRAIGWAMRIYKNTFNEDFAFPVVKNKKDYDALSSMTFDTKLIDEMISKVDFPRYMNLLSIAGGAKERANEKIAKDMLQQWAKAKAYLYVLFGRELHIEKDIDIEITEQEMALLVLSLNEKFPQYAFATETIPSCDWVNNTLDYSFRNNSNWSKIPNIKKGMKVTSALATAYKDDKYNMAVSEVTQNRIITGKLVLSIDPYDYLANAETKTSWDSCFKLNGGAHSNAGVSTMLDECTITAHKTSNREFSYGKEESRYGNFGFKGVSKAWRMFVFFDKNSSSFIIPRAQHPKPNEELENAFKNMITDRFDTLYQDMKWDVQYYQQGNKNLTEITKTAHWFFNDSTQSSQGREGGHLFVPRDSSKKPFFNVGIEDIKCPYCGRKPNSENKLSCGCK